MLKTQNNYKQAARFQREALKLSNKIGAEMLKSDALNNLGELNERLNKPEIALKYYRRSLALKNKIGHKSGAAMSINNIGAIMCRQGDGKDGMEYLNTAVKMWEGLGDKANLSAVYANISDFYMRSRNDYGNATFYLDKAYGLAEGAGHEVFRLALIKGYYELKKKAGDFESALEYHEKYHELNNRLLSEQEIKKLTELSFMHNMSQTEKELEIQKLKNNQFEALIDRMKMSAVNSQLEPHFIGNALTSISGYIRKQPATAEQYLLKFSHLMFDVLDKFRHDFISLEDELSIMRNYMDLEALRQRHTFKYQIKVAPRVDIEIVQVPPLILQPLIENAIKHGMHGGKKKGLICVNIHLDGRLLICCIENTVCGTINRKANERSKRKSFGLEIVHDRLKILSKGKRAKGFLKLIPLKNKMKVMLGIPV